MFSKWYYRLDTKDRWIIGLGCFLGVMPFLVACMALPQQLYGMTSQLFVSIFTLLYVGYTLQKFENEDKVQRIKQEEAEKKAANDAAERKRIAKQIEDEKQKEYEKQIKPYEDMDRKINCPICGGAGQSYFHCRECNVDGEYDYTLQNAILEQDYNEILKEWGSEFAFADQGVYLSHGYCAFCNGTGAVKARFEKSVDRLKDCVNCYSTGKIKKSIKLEVGIGSIDEQCPICNGTGKLADYGKVYVQTALKAPQTGNYRYGIGGAYKFIFNVRDIDRSEDCTRFIANIDETNKDFYSVSQPIEDKSSAY